MLVMIAMYQYTVVRCKADKPFVLSYYPYVTSIVDEVDVEVHIVWLWICHQCRIDKRFEC